MGGDGLPRELRPALTQSDPCLIERGELLGWQPQSDVRTCGFGVVKKMAHAFFLKAKRLGGIAEASGTRVKLLNARQPHELQFGSEWS